MTLETTGGVYQELLHDTTAGSIEHQVVTDSLNMAGIHVGLDVSGWGFLVSGTGTISGLPLAISGGEVFANCGKAAVDSCIGVFCVETGASITCSASAIGYHEIVPVTDPPIPTSVRLVWHASANSAIPCV